MVIILEIYYPILNLIGTKDSIHLITKRPIENIEIKLDNFYRKNGCHMLISTRINMIAQEKLINYSQK